ncbi:MAG TPA: AraC family transcriptional regulator [Flavisolibacter sp.]
MQIGHAADVIPDNRVIQAPLVYECTREIPGSVQYSIRRYEKPPTWMADDAGVLRYHYEAGASNQNYVELRFCLSGNMYCRKNMAECHKCRAQASAHCEAVIESVDFLSFTFSSTLLEQFVKSRLSQATVTDELLAFRHSKPFSRNLPLCGKTRMVIEAMLNHNYVDSLENIYINAQTQMLLLYSLDCLDDKQVDVINCRFLSNEVDREKIMKARDILTKQIGEPITIRELSRRVAMNECYLKKGFKEMFGTTIFDFFQSQRMEHARYLLYEKGLTVTEVSVLLGYSSISHFSTAFKKHTGLKPCELLFRNTQIPVQAC